MIFFNFFVSCLFVSCLNYSQEDLHQAVLCFQIFDDHKLSQLKGNLGVGHTRYSTHGVKASDMTGVQPFVVDTVHGLLAVAHNGELVNATRLRKEVRMHNSFELAYYRGLHCIYWAD